MLNSQRLPKLRPLVQTLTLLFFLEAEVLVVS